MIYTNGPVVKPKRGVAFYSYLGEFDTIMTLEDMLADMHGMDAEGLEILANSHIENYPETEMSIGVCLSRRYFRF